MNLLTYFFNLQKVSTISYVECNQIVAVGRLGAKKMITSNHFMYYNEFVGLAAYYSSFLSGKPLLNSWFFNYLSLHGLFKSVFFGFLSGFRIVGRGYKAYLNFNNLVFRLGYSHNIYYFMPLAIKTFKKEKMGNFWAIRSLDFTQITSIANVIRSFRRGNVYRTKGIYTMDGVYPKKNNKSSATL